MLLYLMLFKRTIVGRTKQLRISGNWQIVSIAAFASNYWDRQKPSQPRYPELEPQIAPRWEAAVYSQILKH